MKRNPVKQDKLDKIIEMMKKVLEDIRGKELETNAVIKSRLDEKVNLENVMFKGEISII